MDYCQEDNSFVTEVCKGVFLGNNLDTVRKITEYAIRNDKKKQFSDISENSSVKNELIELYAEKQLFHAYGDEYTAQKLEEQIALVKLLEEPPQIVYWVANEHSCDKCKALHNSRQPMIHKIAESKKQELSHPNCCCHFSASPPENTLSYSDEKQELKTIINGLGEYFKSLSISEYAHLALDVLGFIPVAGAFFDAANAIYYFIEEDYKSGAFSMLGALPLIGYAATGIKIVNKGAKIVDKAYDAAKAADKISDIAKIANQAIDAAKTAENINEVIKAADKLKDIAVVANKVDDLKDIAKSIDKISDIAKAADNLKDAAKVVEKTADAVKAAEKASDIKKTIKAVENAVNSGKLPDTLKIIKPAVKTASSGEKLASNLKMAEKIKKTTESYKTAKRLSNTVDIAKSIDKTADALKTINNISDSAKTADKVIDRVKLADKAADAMKTSDKTKDAAKAIDKIQDTSKTSEKIFDASKNSDNILATEKNNGILKRESWKQSEIDVAKQYTDHSPQISFKNGQEVNHGTKGSVRPDLFKDGSSIEVKNYDLTKPQNRYNLIRNLNENCLKRIDNLPPGTKQTVIIDIRGQDIDVSVIDQIRKKVNENLTINILWR